MEIQAGKVYHMIMKNLAMSHRIEIYVRLCDGEIVYAICWELDMKFAQTYAMIRMECEHTFDAFVD